LPDGSVTVTHEGSTKGELDEVIEVQTALSVKEKRWLVSCAARIAARAGELSQPFDGQTNALIPSIEALLFLARRMRQAGVWQDDIGFGVAQDDLKRVWQTLSVELKRQSPERVRALDDALTRVSNSHSSAALKSLYTSIQGLHDNFR
jgi:hypothetical protein